MRTGKLTISRGHQLPQAPHLALVPQAEPAPAPACPDYRIVHDRLTSLERLTRLYEQGALSAEEFAVEKMLILGLPAEEPVWCEAAPVGFSPAQPRRPARGPSLVGRMLSWKFLTLSLLVGLGFSYGTQPAETARFLDQVLRFFGA